VIASRTLEWLGAAFFCALGLALFLGAQPLSVPADIWMVDRGFWPRTVGLMMMALSLIMAVQAWLRPSRPIHALPKKPAWLLLASFGAFNLLLPFLGYFAGAFLWMVALGLIAGERSLGRLSGFAAAGVVIGYLLFWKFLLVPLPVGELERWLGLDHLIYR
jgi:hypothetical protein